MGVHAEIVLQKGPTGERLADCISNRLDTHLIVYVNSSISSDVIHNYLVREEKNVPNMPILSAFNNTHQLMQLALEDAVRGWLT